MIQRIQTLWLALAAVCMGLCFVFPVASYTIDYTENQQVVSQLNLVAADGPHYSKALAAGEPKVELFQSQVDVSMWPLVTMTAVVLALALLCICLYKKRTLQMRMVAVAFLLNVVYAFLLFFWAVDAYADQLGALFTQTEQHVTWGVGAFLPLAAIVFFFLAQRAIRKDEALVRAADRLR